MLPSRREALRAVGTTALVGLAGCATNGVLDSEQESRAYTLNVESIDIPPVEDARYEADTDGLFGRSAQNALADVLPDGRHTTYGFRPVPDDAYVEHDGTYFQLATVVTGRKEMERTLVRVDPVARDDVPADALLVEGLDRPVARVVKILHANTQSGGRTGGSTLLRGDAYVVRRPAEREGRLGSGALDGRVVTMTDSGAFAYRLAVTRERITETAYTTLAVEVASSREQFREVVFGSRIDAELAPADLSPDTRECLTSAISRDEYSETEPLSDGYVALLSALGLRGVDAAVNGKRLWYDGEYYRYGLYVNDAQ